MTYTILFVDDAHRTAAIVVIAYDKGDTSPGIIRHAHQKRVEYQKAYLLGQNDFEAEPFYVRQASDGENQEVAYALAVLQERIDGVPARGGLAYGRKKEE